MKRAAATVMVAFTICLLTTCSFSWTDLDAPEKIPIVTAEFTIAWDPPDETETPAGYRVYYSPYKEVLWTTLADIDDGETTEYTITREALPYGEYIFAVTSLSEDESESEKHTSLDDTAEPPSGWYVDWVGVE
jgi:hypothetical protein